MSKLPPKVGCGINSDESIKYCQSSKMYNSDDIKELAKKCGIDIAKKSRDQLCIEIANSISTGTQLETPECNKKNADKCNTYSRTEVDLLAQKCKVSTEGNKATVCARIAKAVLDGSYKTSSSPTPSPSPTPTPAPAPDRKCDHDYPRKCMSFTQNGNSKVFQKVYQYKVKHQMQHLFNSPPQYKGILQDQLYSLTAQKIQIKATLYSDSTLILGGNHGETQYRMALRILR